MMNRWIPNSSQGKESESLETIWCSFQPQILRSIIGRGMFPTVHHRKTASRPGRSERNWSLFGLLESLQLWGCWKQPPGQGQHHPPPEAWQKQEMVGAQAPGWLRPGLGKPQLQSLCRLREVLRQQQRHREGINSAVFEGINNNLQISYGVLLPHYCLCLFKF